MERARNVSNSVSALERQLALVKAELESLHLCSIYADHDPLNREIKLLDQLNKLNSKAFSWELEEKKRQGSAIDRAAIMGCHFQ